MTSQSLAVTTSPSFSTIHPSRADPSHSTQLRKPPSKQSDLDPFPACRVGLTRGQKSSSCGLAVAQGEQVEKTGEGDEFFWNQGTSKQSHWQKQRGKRQPGVQRPWGRMSGWGEGERLIPHTLPHSPLAQPAWEGMEPRCCGCIWLQ